MAVIVYVMNASLALDLLRPLLAMFAAGLLVGLWQARVARHSQEDAPATARPLLKNPFSLWPAVQFGLIFTVILFIARFGAMRFGARGALSSSLVGGLIDVDAITISLANLVAAGDLAPAVGVLAVLLALFANAVFKTGLAFTAGGRRFGWALALAFGAMFAVGFAAAFLIR